MTVEQYLLLITYGQVTYYSINYNKSHVVPRIYCKDGYSLSVQVHRGAHCKFESISSIDETCFGSYSTSFGRHILYCETDSEDLNKYGMDRMQDVENLVNTHGGIDVEKTLDNAITNQKLQTQEKLEEII